MKDRARTTAETDAPANARPSASPSSPRASSQTNPAVVATPIDGFSHRVLFMRPTLPESRAERRPPAGLPARTPAGP